VDASKFDHAVRWFWWQCYNCSVWMFVYTLSEIARCRTGCGQSIKSNAVKRIRTFFSCRRQDVCVTVVIGWSNTLTSARWLVRDQSQCIRRCKQTSDVHCGRPHKRHFMHRTLSLCTVLFVCLSACYEYNNTNIWIMKWEQIGILTVI